MLSGRIFLILFFQKYAACQKKIPAGMEKSAWHSCNKNAYIATMTKNTGQFCAKRQKRQKKILFTLE